jgi:SpoVK/Ycf46/Vps4 family AAA+-type ATPase
MTNKMNHYNQFLIRLDEQQQKERDKEKIYEKDKDIEIDKVIQQISHQFQHKYDNTFFSGYNREKLVTDALNPNFYNDTPIPILDCFNHTKNTNLYPLQIKIPKLSHNTNLCTPIHNKNRKKQDIPIINYDDFYKDVELKLDLERIQKKKPEKEKRKVTVTLEKEINTLEDLLNFIEKNPIEKEVEYNIQLQSLHDIRDSLEELNKIIGMQHLKINIVSQILYFVQEFYKTLSGNEKETTVNTNINTNTNINKNQDFLHTVISGPPGTGKTEIAKLMGKIYSKLGILSKGTFKKVTRSDLIAGYLGQTAIKTREVVQESLGGVLFIDEAYSLGNTEKRDSFSKECIDTLCEALSDHKDNWMVIIAGYEEELNECFFNYNRGLDSRFTWRFHTDEYGAEELYLIFLKKVNDIGWIVFSSSEDVKEKKIDVKWFEKNKEHFKFYGRDMETLLSRIKIAHSKRVFGFEEGEKRKISYEDLEKGLELFLKNTNQKKREAEIERKRIWESIYV